MIDIIAKKGICPLTQRECTGADCLVWEFIPEGQECPILICPDALDVMKDVFLEAAKYLDEVAGVEAGSGGNVLDKARESLADGTVDFKRILTDLLSLPE